MEVIIVNHDRIYGIFGFYIPLSLNLGIIFFAIFLREQPKVPIKKTK